MGLSVLEPEISFSSLSNSLVSWAETTWAMNMTCFAEDKFDILKHNNLNSAKEGRGVLVIQIGVNEQVMYMHWSGAASTILDNCALYYDIIGEFHATENQKIKFGQVIQEMGDASLKLIAFAYRQTDGEQLQQEELIVKAIASGLRLEHGIVLEGRKVKDLNEEAIRRSGSAHVMANLHPEDKLL
ncbi:hypothetical protein JHK87_033969 [Glycine soja]|nr:hypothetical protein JHK87_033969 [Glycine soja]